MKRIVWKNLNIENFKGLRSFSGSFSNVTEIFGKNAVGKTSIADSVSWLLFGKDSQGRSDFQIRPVDSTGATIDNTEITVSATLTVSDDDEPQEIILEKKQIQNWVKRRGTSTAVFQGNVNKYFVNTYPVTQKEYEAKVFSIIDEPLFRQLTDPTAFPNLPWKDERETLARFVSDVTDADIIALNEAEFEPIKDEVLLAGADKVQQKYAATLKRLKDDQKAFPIRIDEASRNIVETQDKSILMEKKSESESILQGIQNERRSLSTASNVTEDILSQITQKQRRMAEIERSTMLEDEKKNLEATKAANTAFMETRKAESDRDALANKRTYLAAAINENKKAKTELKDQYIAFASAKFPESETICPTCGRPFDADKVADLKADFEKRRQSQIDALNKKGFALKDKIDADEKTLAQIEKQIAGYTADIEGLNAKWEELKKIADSPVRTDYRTIPEYQKLQTEIDSLNEKLASVEDTSAAKKDLEERELFAMTKLRQVEAEIAKCDANKQSEERVEELKEAQRDCGQKVADCEKILFLIEQFVKLKMDTLSDRINSHFKKVRFKLFETQINGAIKECCKMQINTNGAFVDYSNANHAGQILGGLDVIEALSELNQVSAPVWIDNAECFSSDNMPECKSQMILLTVSDDETLQIERR